VATIAHRAPERLNRDEVIAQIDREARRRRNLSGAELMASFQAGTLREPGAVADLLVLADLLDEGDPFLRGELSIGDKARLFLRGRTAP
jgi:hypothetical protein